MLFRSALTTVASQYLDGQAMMNCADSTAAQADSEVRDLLQSAYDKAMGLLRQHRELLDEISLFLLAKETITGDELMAFVNADKKQLPAAEDVAEDAPADSSEAPAADGDAASSADQPETGSQETPSDPSGDPS